MPYFCPDMRPLVGLVVGLYGLYAQCARCGISGSPILPRGFNPSSITLTAGRDTEVVIQFTLPDTVQQGSLTLYPNYAIYVDSLRMAGGNTYVVVKGTASTPVSYAMGPSHLTKTLAISRYEVVFVPGWWCTAIPPLPRRTHSQVSLLRRKDVSGHV
jgi:hypothetical protein